jgi:hypothetical protein
VIFFSVPYEGDVLPRPDELEALTELEWKLDAALSECEAVNVASITFQQKREWISYAKDGAATADLLSTRFSEWGPTIEHRPDPRWDEYKGFKSMAVSS